MYKNDTQFHNFREELRCHTTVEHRPKIGLEERQSIKFNSKFYFTVNKLL